MNLLTINAGSSTVRLALFRLREGTSSVLKNTSIENKTVDSYSVLEQFFVEPKSSAIRAVIHRFVHGGSEFSEPCIITSEIRSKLNAVSALAPLHNPQALEWLDASAEIFPESVVQIAVFDTALYADVPDYAYTYGVPATLSRKYHLRRYGFHGLAHSAMLSRLSEVLPRSSAQKVISLQLGSGCSMTAFKNGVAVDTSMGFTPLEGLLMATRSGDIDPGILLYLQQQENISGSELEQLLNYESGLKGISNVSGDMRELIGSEAAESKLAIEVYCYRIKKYLGAFMAVLGGVDTIVFGGGVGEHQPDIRKKVLEGFRWYGLEIDDVCNRKTIGSEQCISSNNSQIAVWVVQVNEAQEMLRCAQPLMPSS